MSDNKDGLKGETGGQAHKSSQEKPGAASPEVKPDWMQEVQKGTKAALKDLIYDANDMLEPVAKAMRSLQHKDAGVDALKLAGWAPVDLKLETSPLHKLLENKPVDSYNCKYYVKGYIEGRLPPGDGRREEMDPEYLKSKGYEPVKDHRFQLGDIVMVRTLAGNSAAKYAHVALVEKVAPVTGNILSFIQKPDCEHPVSRCSKAAFDAAYKVDGVNASCEIYRKYDSNGHK